MIARSFSVLQFYGICRVTFLSQIKQHLTHMQINAIFKSAFIMLSASVTNITSSMASLHRYEPLVLWGCNAEGRVSGRRSQAAIFCHSGGQRGPSFPTGPHPTNGAQHRFTCRPWGRFCQIMPDPKATVWPSSSSKLILLTDRYWVTKAVSLK